MSAILIVLVLVALGVGIVVWATRRRPHRPYDQRQEQDTAWNDPTSPAEAAPTDPFANAPPPADRTEPRP